MCTLVPVAFVLMFMGVCTFNISKRFLYLKCENAETVIENHSPWTFQQSQTITDRQLICNYKAPITETVPFANFPACIATKRSVDI